MEIKIINRSNRITKHDIILLLIGVLCTRTYIVNARVERFYF